MGTVIQFATTAPSRETQMRQAFAEGIRGAFVALAGKYSEKDAQRMAGYCLGAERAFQVAGDDYTAELFESAAAQIQDDWRSIEYVLRSLHAALH